MKIREMFEDWSGVLSWLRVVGLVVVLVGCFGLCYSIAEKYEPGILASVGVISSVLALKAYQTKQERLGDSEEEK